MVAWSTTDKSANITLSGGNLIATTTSATQGAVRGDTSFTGKTYFEGWLTVGTGLWCVGFANATAALGTQPGADVNSVAYFPLSSLSRFNAAVVTQQLGNVGGAACIAIDPVAKLFWARWNNGIWNFSATADPATGTGGISLTSLGAGPYFPIFAANSSGAQIVGRFGAGDMAFAVPTGFATLDTNVQAFEAASKLISYAILRPPQTAVSAFKFVSYAILSNPLTSVDVYKLISYAILGPSAIAVRQNQEWPVPQRPRPLRPNGLSVPTNIALGVPPAVIANPFLGASLDLPMRRTFRMGWNPEGRIPPVTATDEFMVTLTWAAWPQF